MHQPLFAAFFEEEYYNGILAEGDSSLKLIGIYSSIELFQKACEIHFETIRSNYKDEKLNWSPVSRTIYELTHKSSHFASRYIAMAYKLDKLPDYGMHTNAG